MVWVTCLTGFVIVAAGVAYLWFSTPIPQASAVATSQETRVLYSDGSLLGSVGKTNRESLTSIDQIPLAVREAVLAAEDRNFYHEPGISIRGIARAVIVDATGGSVQGGSTITQQYAKNAYLTQKRTLSRKLREVVIAEKLDRKQDQGRGPARLPEHDLLRSRRERHPGRVEGLLRQGRQQAHRGRRARSWPPRSSGRPTSTRSPIRSRRRRAGTT